MTTPRLQPHHFADLKNSGLSDETISAARCYSAQEPTVRALLGFGVGPGLVFEFPDTETEEGVPFVQVKPDTRPAWMNGAKYLTPKNGGCRLYVPAILSRDILSNGAVPLCLTEGCKKALKATQEGLPCLALAGVDAWRDRRSGKSTPIPDLDRIVWKGRRVCIVFDSDLVTKPAVRWAEFRLARELHDRGAEVFAVRLPGGPNGEKVGLDDYLCTHSVDTFCALEPARIHHPKADVGRREATTEAPPLQAPTAEIPFPESAYLGVAGEVANLYAEYVESPRPFLLMSFLTYLGAALGPYVSLSSELRPAPRLYTVLVGETSLGRKSSAMGHVDRFFEPVLQDRVAVLHGLGSAEGIGRVVREKGIPVLLSFDELRLFVEKAKQDGFVALPMVTTLFESTRYQNHTRDRSLVLENAHLSVLAASTQETYESMWASQFIDIGFLNRLFVVLARRKSKRAFPDPIPPASIEGLREKTRRQLDQFGRTATAVPLPLTAEAKSRWTAWYDSLTESVHANRLDTIGLRLLMLFAITSDKSEIDTGLVEATIALLDYQLAVRRVLDPIDAENAVARMEERIRRALVAGRMTKRELQRRVHAHRAGVWVFTTAVKNLVKENEIAEKKGQYWRRPLS